MSDNEFNVPMVPMNAALNKPRAVISQISRTVRLPTAVRVDAAASFTVGFIIGLVLTGNVLSFLPGGGPVKLFISMAIGTLASISWTYEPDGDNIWKQLYLRFKNRKSESIVDTESGKRTSYLIGAAELGVHADQFLSKLGPMRIERSAAEVEAGSVTKFGELIEKEEDELVEETV